MNLNNNNNKKNMYMKRVHCLSKALIASCDWYYIDNKLWVHVKKKLNNRLVLCNGNSVGTLYRCIYFTYTGVVNILILIYKIHKKKNDGQLF